MYRKAKHSHSLIILAKMNIHQIIPLHLMLATVMKKPLTKISKLWCSILTQQKNKVWLVFDVGKTSQALRKRVNYREEHHYWAHCFTFCLTQFDTISNLAYLCSHGHYVRIVNQAVLLTPQCFCMHVCTCKLGPWQLQSLQSLNKRQLHQQWFRGASTDPFDKASHLTPFCAWDSNLNLWISPA